MKLVKYILIRVLLLCLLLLAANQLYKMTFWKGDISDHASVMEKMWELDNDADAIYFGESSNFHVTPGDSVKHRISYILDDLIPELNINTVDHAGIHAGTYSVLLNNIPKDISAKTFIVTMNFRSFGANWRYAEGENYLARTERMLQANLPILNKFLVSVKQYDNKTADERVGQFLEAWRKETFEIPGFQYNNVIAWDSAMANHTWIDENPYLNDDNINLACHYIKNFAFDIDTLTNERISDFDEIMKIAQKKGYTIVFNLLGENMLEAKQLVGDDLIYLMEKNRKFLIERYEGKGAIIVDNLNKIPDSCFVDRHWPTEHYTKAGKTMVALSIKESLFKHQLFKEE